MREFAFIFAKEAAPKLRSGSYADGIAGQSLCLPLAVVGPHVNLPSSDHSEVASDENRFASCFLALCAEALIKTYCDFGNTYSHNRKLLVVLESLERLVKSTSSALLPKKRASATRQMLPHVSLEEQTLKVLVFPLAKIRHISESAKYSESALSQNKRSICLSVGRRSINISLESAPIHTDYNPPQRYPFLPELQVRWCAERSVRETLPLPYETCSRGHLVRQTAFSHTESSPVMNKTI